MDLRHGLHLSQCAACTVANIAGFLKERWEVRDLSSYLVLDNQEFDSRFQRALPRGGNLEDFLSAERAIRRNQFWIAAPCRSIQNAAKALRCVSCRNRGNADILLYYWRQHTF